MDKNKGMTPQEAVVKLMRLIRAGKVTVDTPNKDIVAMVVPRRVPAEVRQELQEWLSNDLNWNDFDVNCESCHGTMWFKYKYKSSDGAYCVNGSAKADVEYYSGDFDHAFGTQHVAGSWVFNKLLSFDIEEAYFVDENGNEIECDVD